MANFLKRLVGRLLTYFGGLITVLGVAGLFEGSGTGNVVLILALFSFGFILLISGITLRLL